MEVKSVTHGKKLCVCGCIENFIINKGKTMITEQIIKDITLDLMENDDATIGVLCQRYEA